MNSELRIWRHMLLAIVLAIISFNQTYVIFQQNITELGCNLYWITLCNLASYLVVVYLNIYLLIPRYLMRKRYLLYTIVLFVIVFVLMCLLTIIEEGVHVILGQDISYFLNPIFILNYVSSFATIVLCLLGGAITIVLRHWTIDNKRVNQLEWIHIQSEVEQLKAQVNPQLLFNILDRTAVLARSKPDEASGMLLKLSQLLRYQLYDCSRKAVLLKGEINFLTNYLALEQLYSKRIWYSVAAEGEVYGLSFPPCCLSLSCNRLLFIFTDRIRLPLSISNFVSRIAGYILFVALITEIYWIRMIFRASNSDWNYYTGITIPCQYPKESLS